MAAASDEQIVTPSEVRSELLRILASPDFAASKQLTSFLEYIVGESLSGQAATLKERTVARRALGRGASFDPRLDCVVRVVAGKLRRSLDRYYALQGTWDSLCIEVPKGTYCPVFRRRHPTVRSRDWHDSAPTADAAGDGARALPIVAVVPLKSFTGGPKERFLADLLADDVAVRLGRVSGLEVIDCLAMRSPWNRTQDVCTIALAHHANFVVSGTVSKVGRLVRLTVRLVDGQSGILAWGAQYDGQIDNGPFAQQDHIADSVARSIREYFGLA